MVQENSLGRVLVICGPTASGKTALAVRCAELLDSEVISADSMCVYRGCDIGTAKPTDDEKRGIPHHLIDVVPPSAVFSVGDYREHALPIINSIIQSGKIPVICGGTGFYINSILFDLSYGNAPAEPQIREKYEKILKEKGKEYLHSLLEVCDVSSAQTLHVNDTKRVIRALEIFESTGKRKSELDDGLVPKFDYLSFAVDYPREELYERINLRVDQMLENGLIDEVKGLLASGVTANSQCMQGIGYKEVCQGLSDGMTLPEIAELIKFNTRHYAKRQITFFKRDERLALLKKGSVDELAEIIIGKLQ